MAVISANSARLRLLRLSEAAEKLQRQALTSVRTGKENDARDLLFQKKKVMQALEKSKSRIDLLDELSAKLNEAISVKETQLVSAVTLDLEAGKEEVSPPVRIVSPKEEGSRNSDKFEDFDTNSLMPGEHQESQVDEQGQPELSSHNDPKILEGTFIGDQQNEANAASSLKGISSYEEFLEHLDQQLNNIEAELVTVLRFSTMVLEGGEKSKNLKLQQTEEILEAVCRIRKRIASIQQTKVGIR